LLVRVSGVEEDRQEFAEFYAAARDNCLRIVLISVGDRQLAQDLVAEAFTQGVDGLAEGKPAPSAAGVDSAHRAQRARLLVAAAPQGGAAYQSGFATFFSSGDTS
jgi:hypothetical protein